MNTHRYALIDCNNFFVSCERVFRPDLWQKPVAVLSNNDGCIIARSNEVKALGVKMGVPLFQVRDIMEQHKVTLFSANFELYGDMSQRIVTILREEVPLIEVYSIDECFMNLSELPMDDAEAWAWRVRYRILKEVGVPVSIGIAPTKTLAKVASTHAKHHGGVAVIESDEDRVGVLQDLPVQDIWGVGRQLGPKLRDKGISTALQLIESSDAWLRQQFTITGMRMVYELRGMPQLAFGDKHDTRKSIMRSRSFGHTIRAHYQIESAIATFAAQAASRLRAQDGVCRSVVTYLATGKHSAVYRRATQLTRLPEATADTGQIIAAALKGLELLYDEDFGYKKAGVILLDISSREAWQLAMIEGDARRDDKAVLMHTVDGLNARYGHAVWHATEKPKDVRWHSQRKLRSPRYTTQWQELPVIAAS